MSLSQRLLSLILLVAYAMTGTAVLPASLALLASLDDSHAVQVGQSAQGVSLRLQHRSGEYTPEVADHCQPLAQVLVRFCERDPAGDHQLVTRRVHASTSLEREAVHAGLKSAPLFNAAATTVLRLLLPPVREAPFDRRLAMTPSAPVWRPVPATVQLQI